MKKKIFVGLALLTAVVAIAQQIQKPAVPVTPPAAAGKETGRVDPPPPPLPPSAPPPPAAPKLPFQGDEAVLISCPEPPLPPAVTEPASNLESPVADAAPLVEDLPKDYKEFLKRNPGVKSIGWTFTNKVNIHLHNGQNELYDLGDKDQVTKLEAKYGKLPAPPPPPPPAPPSRG